VIYNLQVIGHDSVDSCPYGKLLFSQYENMTTQDSKEPLVADVQTLMAHLWMVRTFLKHCDEFEQAPEYLHIPRTIFDVIRAIETRTSTSDSGALVAMVRKKVPRLRKVADEFSSQIDEISSHTNFKMAAVSLSACADALQMIADQYDHTSH
jgi:hypothetical protein|tara:strand:- start:1402 stop:1857 length:456 start_codon:yes stop_codon:yes gene_type:complete